MSFVVIAPGWGVRLEWERDDLIASAFTVLATVQQTDAFSWWHDRDAKYHHCVREYEYTLRVGYPDRLPNFFRGRPSQSGHSGSTVVRETPEQACDNQKTGGYQTLKKEKNPGLVKSLLTIWKGF